MELHEQLKHENDQEIEEEVKQSDEKVVSVLKEKDDDQKEELSDEEEMKELERLGMGANFNHQVEVKEGTGIKKNEDSDDEKAALTVAPGDKKKPKESIFTQNERDENMAKLEDLKMQREMAARMRAED